MTLDELLDRVSVIECDEMNIALSVKHDAQSPDDLGGAVHPHPCGWFGVVDDEGLIAYFSTETEAFYYRLSYINRLLNNSPNKKG
jgi:hypothetical protein